MIWRNISLVRGNFSLFYTVHSIPWFLLLVKTFIWQKKCCFLSKNYDRTYIFTNDAEFFVYPYSKKIIHSFIFLPLRYSVKSIFATLLSQKRPFWDYKNCFLESFSPQKIAKIKKIDSKLISRKKLSSGGVS